MSGPVQEVLAVEIKFSPRAGVTVWQPGFGLEPGQRNRLRELTIGFGLLSAGLPLILTPAPGLLISAAGLRRLAPHYRWARVPWLWVLRRTPRSMRRRLKDTWPARQRP